MILHNVVFFLSAPPKNSVQCGWQYFFITSARGLHGQFSSNMTNTNTPNPTLIESLHSVERKFLISFKVTLSPLKHGKGHHSPLLFFTPDVAFFTLARPVSSLLPSPSALSQTSSDQPLLVVGPWSTSIRWEREGSLFSPPGCRKPVFIEHEPDQWWRELSHF